MAREYTSTVRAERAEATRRRLVTTATEMFCARGWSATTMADVATAAGIARQTVYQQFAGKLDLLDACIDLALTAGQGGAVRALDDYRAMGHGTLDARITAGSSWLRGAHERSARIQNVLDQAAVTDAEAAARLRVREQNRWEEVRHAVSLILSSTPDDELVDALWVLASRRTYLMLVDGRGWTSARWQEWFAVQTGHAITDD
ncbi:TetR/AcrR family transcriptional regulator [Williamsia deligens]|uniref:TetR/AcrR family transcriptional regulator n=1 Tax=Williamsia deligens TaxID=321325 RepID=A0ABW3GAH8_9NOCA|nr:TetR/AcrR family transcriptional regulator [Williamsia deligens]MCP2196106.1 transcriptional regulator, TetR family [Williamsia deligens]